MTSTLIDNIEPLAKPDSELVNVALLLENGPFSWIGKPAPASVIRIDAEGRCVIPGFVDSHSHLMFAGDRSEDSKRVWLSGYIRPEEFARQLIEPARRPMPNSFPRDQESWTK